MSEIKLLLEKQAAAVKANAEKIKAAEALERQAAALRADANKPALINFKAYAQAKKERLEQFSKAMADGKKKEIEQILTSNGWALSFRNAEENRYSSKAAPGYSISVKGVKFAVFYHQEKKADLFDTVNLKAFLKHFKPQ